MCGLVGLLDMRTRRDFDPALVQRMTDAIAHRGPDGEGAWLEPGLALGHRRLAIIDLAGGSQPMRTTDGRLAVVFNGEIYNFQELRAELAGRGARFETRSDTEVLLHGWRYWGESMFARLHGMFAFALWDAGEETLVLARDRFGKKPLHYAELADGRLVFGSEIKALAPVPGLPRDLDPTAVADFFAYGYVPDPKTIYRAIRKLPAAHAMITRRGASPRLLRFWSPLEPSSNLVAQTEDELVERLARAVRSRLIAEVPLGALLSGGVDSSAVVAMMARQSKQPVRTFSISFGERGYDESEYASAVAELYGANHTVRRLDAVDVELVARLPEIYDEPFGDVSAIPTFAVCAQARQLVTVALSGDGGDEALGGYRRYAFHMAEERLRAWLPADLRRSLFGRLADVYPRGAWMPRPLRAKTTLRELSLDAAGAYARIVSALPEEARRPLFSADFHRTLNGYDPGETVRAAFNVDADLDPLQRAQYADLTTYLPGDILTKVDRASMANSLELRSPFLDADFFSWSFHLPPSAKISPRAGGKAILKKAMERYLPKDLLYRPKRGFTVPLAEWLRGPLRRQLRATAESARLRESGFIDAGEVENLVRLHLSGRRDCSKALWLVWVFDAFLAHAAA